MEKEEEATHLIYMDVPDDVIDACALVYEDYEDVGETRGFLAEDKSEEKEPLNVSFDNLSECSVTTVQTVLPSGPLKVNYSWVYN